jgi:hypothetical protein
MADKKISDLTAATAVTTGDLLEIETAAGASRKIDSKLLGTSFGTSFPGSPTSGDRFYRTDRHIDYFYDGTRWLSLELYCDGIETIVTTSASVDRHRVVPFTGDFDLYIEKFNFAWQQTAGATTANYFVGQIQYGGSDTNIGSTLTTQNSTLNVWSKSQLAINAVMPASAEKYRFLFVETGSATASLVSGLTYRLVG